MFSYFKTNATFDFVANIFSNVSSLKAGRQFMIEAGLLKQIIAVVQDDANLSVQRRKSLLACLRNICFEYEKYEQDFI